LSGSSLERAASLAEYDQDRARWRDATRDLPPPPDVNVVMERAERLAAPPKLEPPKPIVIEGWPAGLPDPAHVFKIAKPLRAWRVRLKGLERREPVSPPRFYVASVSGFGPFVRWGAGTTFVVLDSFYCRQLIAQFPAEWGGGPEAWRLAYALVLADQLNRTLGHQVGEIEVTR